MKKMISMIMVLISFVFCTVTYAGTVATFTTKIKRLGFYSGFGPGLVQIEVETSPTGCEGGFFITSTDDAYQTVLSALLTAYSTKQDVVIIGQDHDTTTSLGGGLTYCKVYFVHYQ